MPSIARCPLCGKKPDICTDYYPMRVTCCALSTEGASAWNKYAKHSRKGQMFEWLEWQQSSALDVGRWIRMAREWRKGMR